ncbi:hypothetical protein CL656_03950 [bacterium]|nr:hypothetical protein [bacterium]|tara:strand:- start:4656 stop:5291 length:636 start_codon:yes stop_codon:yes gene_type:complete
MSTYKAVESIINGNFYFEFGLQNRILNLTQLARLIKPLVCKRLDKSIEISSIKMALSRLQSQIKDKIIPHKLLVEDVSIKKNLCSLTLYKTRENQENVSKFQNYCSQKDKFFTRSESNKEIAISFTQDLILELSRYNLQNFKFIQKDLGAVLVSIPVEYINIKGVFQYFIQKVTMQNINLLEIGSTYTELIFYMHEKDLSLAANTFLDLQS